MGRADAEIDGRTKTRAELTPVVRLLADMGPSHGSSATKDFRRATKYNTIVHHARRIVEVVVGRHRKIQTLIDRYFPASSHPYRILEREIEKHLHPGAVVLEIGCGRSAPVLSMFRNRGAKLIGIDVVPFDLKDPEIGLVSCSVTSMTPIESESISVAFSRSVMEHVEDVNQAYSEIKRVLKPGGVYIFLTPNFWDYGSLLSSVVPNFLHGKIVKLTEGRAEEDTFPTHYHSNTRLAIRRLSTKSGLHIRSFDYIGQYPNYFSFSPTLFRMGCLYARFLRRVRPLHGLQGWIFCTLQK